MTAVNYEARTEMTPASAAPPSRQQAGPAELAAWQHGVDEAAQAISQMTGTGGHSAAIATGRPYSVADTCDPRIPASPGQQPSMDALTALHQSAPGQGT